MSETQPPRLAFRRLGAVLAGFLVIVVLSIGTDIVMHVSGIFPPMGEPMANALWLLATAYRIVYGVAGGYIAARLAPDQPMGHAMVLGIVGVILSAVGAAATWNEGPAFGPRWFPLSLIAIALPCAWIGGRLQEGRTGDSAAVRPGA